MGQARQLLCWCARASACCLFSLWACPAGTLLWHGHHGTGFSAELHLLLPSWMPGTGSTTQFFLDAQLLAAGNDPGRALQLAGIVPSATASYKGKKAAAACRSLLC